MKQIISAHNRRLLRKFVKTPQKSCTCKKETCPVEGQCKQTETVYQATVSHTSPETGQEVKETYIGLAATTFYERHQNHKTTFKLRSHETKSELSKYFWKLKDQNIVCKIDWKIIDRAPKFTPISKTCKLCTLERFYLLCKKESYTLNKNKEFGDECLHKRFLKLSTAK